MRACGSKALACGHHGQEATVSAFVFRLTLGVCVSVCVHVLREDTPIQCNNRCGLDVNARGSLIFRITTGSGTTGCRGGIGSFPLGVSLAHIDST